VAACPGVPTGLARAAARERWLVTPALEAAPVGSFSVAGCAGRKLGTAAMRVA
jgi:hypothetical protein